MKISKILTPLFMLGAVTLSSCAKKSTNVIKPMVGNDVVLSNFADVTAREPDDDVPDRILRDQMVSKLMAKRNASSLFSENERVLSIPNAVSGHTKLYQFKGKYRVMVIPVQFSDVKFRDAKFFKEDMEGQVPAQNYIFGDGKNSMASYYKHASLGMLKLSGEVTPIITVNNTLEAYGKAEGGRSDKNARGLVVDVLEQLKKIKTNEDWWLDFDRYDLSDYDKDKNFFEPDGFIDAVVLIYAGQSQASCQRSFDPEGKRPGSDDVPAGPRHDNTVECFNRIWPHRWGISLPATDPRYTAKGPVVEGIQRPSMNGYKISDNLYALDYNMQSEFSDRSTFIHEFGHSLTLPDVYSKGSGNSTGAWEVMSSNANLQAQEMSTFSKLSLGWINPKVIKQGEETSMYLGSYNFVSNEQRENLKSFTGPLLNENGDSIVSFVPDFKESVYRAAIVLTDPSSEVKKVVDFKTNNESRAVYSGRFDGEARSVKYSFDVPTQGDATLSFDTIYSIETETNWNTKASKVKVTTDFDIGAVIINEEIVDEIRTISGDENFDSLSEKNPSCKAELVLALRLKKIAATITDIESEQYKKEYKECSKPVWVNKSYDLSKYRGKSVELEVRLTTDGGYTEFGIVVDNIKFSNAEVISFENESDDLGDWKELVGGHEKLFYNQFYLMEYRNPGESYSVKGAEKSYNMDTNIKQATQSMFIEEGDTLADKFRMVTFDYKPGVLVWYFNSKYNRSTNDPMSHEGKGYLLVLNSKVKELPLPGVMSKSDYFDKDGNYVSTKTDTELKRFIESQRAQFKCFAYIDYATYLDGKAPDCAGVDFLDYMQGLTFAGKKLIYRRERFNETLPLKRYSTVGVGIPFRIGASMRTGMSTFGARGQKNFSPFKVYKEVSGEMVLDEALTKSSASVKQVSSFKDSENTLTKVDKFKGDSVVVEKTGFEFEVVKPSRQALKQYSKDVSVNDNSHFFRRPRVKVYFDWKK